MEYFIFDIFVSGPRHVNSKSVAKNRRLRKARLQCLRSGIYSGIRLDQQTRETINYDGNDVNVGRARATREVAARTPVSSHRDASRERRYGGVLGFVRDTLRSIRVLLSPFSANTPRKRTAIDRPPDKRFVEAVSTPTLPSGVRGTAAIPREIPGRNVPGCRPNNSADVSTTRNPPTE